MLLLLTSLPEQSEGLTCWTNGNE